METSVAAPVAGMPTMPAGSATAAATADAALFLAMLGGAAPVADLAPTATSVATSTPAPVAVPPPAAGVADDDAFIPVGDLPPNQDAPATPRVAAEARPGAVPVPLLELLDLHDGEPDGDGTMADGCPSPPMAGDEKDQPPPVGGDTILQAAPVPLVNVMMPRVARNDAPASPAAVPAGAPMPPLSRVSRPLAPPTPPASVPLPPAPPGPVMVGDAAPRADDGPTAASGSSFVGIVRELAADGSSAEAPAPAPLAASGDAVITRDAPTTDVVQIMRMRAGRVPGATVTSLPAGDDTAVPLAAPPRGQAAATADATQAPTPSPAAPLPADAPAVAVSRPAAMTAAPRAPVTVEVEAAAVPRRARRADPVETIAPALDGVVDMIATAAPGVPAAVASADSAAASAVAAAPLAEVAMRHRLDLAQGSQWLDQLSRDIVRTAGNDGRLNFRLNPDALGSLAVEVRHGAEGAHVRIIADSEAARAIIADAQPRLVQEARAQGVRIADAQVDIGRGQTDGQRQQQQQQQGATQTPIMRAVAPRRARAVTVNQDIPASGERYA